MAAQRSHALIDVGVRSANAALSFLFPTFVAVMAIGLSHILFQAWRGELLLEQQQNRLSIFGHTQEALLSCSSEAD